MRTKEYQDNNLPKDKKKRCRDRESEGKGPDHEAKEVDGKHMTR